MKTFETSHYPGDIAAVLRERWSLRQLPSTAIPDYDVTVSLLDTMYQASLLREESATVRCRIVFVAEEFFASDIADGARPAHVLRFDEPVPYTAHNLRKLAAAAGFYRALLGVERGPLGDLRVWGMVVTGTEWINQLGRGESSGAPLSDSLVLQILAPGHIVVASGYSRILESDNGRLLTDGFDPFLSQWLPKRFSGYRASLLRELEPQPEIGGPCLICEDFVKDVAQLVVHRVLRLARIGGHGGMLVFLPEGSAETPIPDEWFRFRARFRPDDSTFRFRRLMLKLMNRVASVGEARGLLVVTFDDYLRMHDAELSDIDEALVEFSHLLADLMSVDGSLVVDRGFRLIGFGGEILGESHVSTIHQALDLEAENTIAERSDTFGTRHRSAYRLVNGLNESIAVVVSQDGDVRFVACHNQKLTYWPYLP